jgi:hypothetical protein
VVAIRGTMSMADVVTDAVVHPEGIDDWLPPKLSKVSINFLDKEVGACEATSCIGNVCLPLGGQQGSIGLLEPH